MLDYETLKTVGRNIYEKLNNFAQCRPDEVHSIGTHQFKLGLNLQLFENGTYNKNDMFYLKKLKLHIDEAFDYMKRKVKY